MKGRFVHAIHSHVVASRCPQANKVCFTMKIYHCALFHRSLNMACNFTSGMLYESAYNIPFHWNRHLPNDVYRYHELVWKETNAPVEIHMGVVLPFVSACLGPKTKGHFLTRPSVLNLFWINVAASGVGKSVTRQRFITEPLEYLINTSNAEIPDFEISRFTQPGM